MAGSQRHLKRFTSAVSMSTSPTLHTISLKERRVGTLASLKSTVSAPQSTRASDKRSRNPRACFRWCNRLWHFTRAAVDRASSATGSLLIERELAVRRVSQHAMSGPRYRLWWIGTPRRRDYLTSKELKDSRKTAETCANTRRSAIRMSRKISALRPHLTLIGYSRCARILRKMMNPRVQAFHTCATATQKHERQRIQPR